MEKEELAKGFQALALPKSTDDSILHGGPVLPRVRKYERAAPYHNQSGSDMLVELLSSDPI